jgi:dipeptidase E
MIGQKLSRAAACVTAIGWRPDEMTDVLLLSNSRAPGQGYLEHARTEIAGLLAGRQRLLFIAFASSEPDRYTQLMREAMAPLRIIVEAAHAMAGGPAGVLDAVAKAEAVFVGGGNSFRLLRRMRAVKRDGEAGGQARAPGALDVLRGRALDGMPYIGVSAGSNLACPTIRTTNDMPIVHPGPFEALGLIPFQVNPHYPYAEATGTRSGESREQRLAEFVEENDVPVLGLREGTWLRVTGGRGSLGGVAEARLFRRGAAAAELAAGSDVSWLLDLPARFDVPA